MCRSAAKAGPVCKHNLRAEESAWELPSPIESLRSLCHSKVRRNRTGAPRSHQRTWPKMVFSNALTCGMTEPRSGFWPIGETLLSRTLKTLVGFPGFVQPVEPRSAYQIAARRTLSSEILVLRDRPRIHRDIRAAYSTWKGTSPRVM
jgi:hypothetical protein